MGKQTIDSCIVDREMLAPFWDTVEEKFIPEVLDKEDREFLKFIFYCGVTAAVSLMCKEDNNISSQCVPLDKDESDATLNMLFNECLIYTYRNNSRNN